MRGITRSAGLFGCVVAVLLVAASPAAAGVHLNAAEIQINDKVPGDQNSGQASPYPAPINVSGEFGGITGLEITLHGVTHSYLNDVGIVVESPAGDALLLMNAIGPESGPTGPGTGANDLDLTFADDAATGLANDSVPTTSGSYRPTNHAGLDPFPSPGPGTDYGNPGPGGSGTATLMGEFGGGPANGDWNLYVLDFESPDDGTIAGGWSLDVTTDGDIEPPATKIVSGPSGTITQSSAQFSFDTDPHEEGATFDCRLAGQSYAPCTSPKTLTGLTDGTHTFEVRARDAAHNVGPPASRTFTVDVPAPPPPPPPPPPAGDDQSPSVTIDKLVAKSKKRLAKVTFSGVDNVSPASALSFTCKLDGKAAKPCTSVLKLKKLKPKKHKIAVVARDEAGNESAPAVKRFRIKKRR